MKSRKQRVIISFVGLAFFLVLALGSEDPSGPRLEVLSHYANSDIYTDETGGPDWGYQVTVRARNNGEAGTVRAVVKLYTGEGMFSREKVVNFSSGEERELAFIFTEPSFVGEFLNEEIRYKFHYEK